MSRFLYAFWLLLVLCVPTWSQTTTISIGGVDLRLGMTKKQVQEKFPPKSYLTFGWEVDHVMLYQKIRDPRKLKDDPPLQEIGTLAFANDRLVRAFKNWENSANDECMKVAQGLFNSLVAMNESRPVTAMVAAYSRIEPDVRTDRVDIMFGDRTIRLTIMKGQPAGLIGMESVSVEEFI